MGRDRGSIGRGGGGPQHCAKSGSVRTAVTCSGDPCASRGTHMTADAAKPRAGARRLLALIATSAVLVTACTSTAPTIAPSTAPTSAASAGASSPAAASNPPTTAPSTAAPTQAGPAILNVAATANITTWDPVKSFSTEALYMAN